MRARLGDENGSETRVGGRRRRPEMLREGGSSEESLAAVAGGRRTLPGDPLAARLAPRWLSIIAMAFRAFDSGVARMVQPRAASWRLPSASPWRRSQKTWAYGFKSLEVGRISLLCRPVLG